MTMYIWIDTYLSIYLIDIYLYLRSFFCIMHMFPTQLDDPDFLEDTCLATARTDGAPCQNEWRQTHVNAW